MTLAAAKQKLHEYVDKADSKKVKAILTLLENDDEPDYEVNNEVLEDSIQRGLKQSGIKSGRQHEDVIAGLRKRYNL